MNYATFRFVPIEPDRIVTPPVPLDEICFDRPLAKGSVSGTIEVTWTAKTPICIGGEGEGKEDSPVRALKIGDRHCLPGSTLRGMVRAVLEAATFSHLGRINSAHHHGVRDFVGYGEHHRYRPDDVRAGWLRYHANRDRWAIHPAKRARREDREVDLLLTPFDSIFKRMGADASIIDGWQLHKEVWEKLAALPDGLRMKPLRPFWPHQDVGRTFPGPPKVLMHRPTDPVQQNRYYSNAEHVLVVTGPARQAGDEKTERRDDDKKLKESEALFPLPDERPESEIVVPTRFMEVFHRMHSDPGREGGDPRDAWRFWLRAFGWERRIGQFKEAREEPDIPTGTGNSKLGIPVFWKGEPANVTESAEPGGQDFWFDLSRVIRVPYLHSVGEVAARLYRNHPTGGYRQPRLDEEGGWDFARAMFGEVDAANTDPNTTGERRRPDGSEREEALKGRVAFGFAWAAPGLTETPPMGGVFAQPRESFWPFYLAPREGAARAGIDYGHADAVPAGRKRTLVRRTAVPAASWPRGNENPETFTYLRFLNAGARFTGQVRFHNLHPVELGALLWALGFGRTDGTLWHQAGRAKGFGYGALSPSFRFARGPVIRNVAQPPTNPADASAWIMLFLEYMTEKLEEPFEAHRAVAPLIAFADPATGAAEAGKLTVSTLDEYRGHRDAAKAGRFGPDMTRNRLPDPE